MLVAYKTYAFTHYTQCNIIVPIFNPNIAYGQSILVDSLMSFRRPHAIPTFANMQHYPMHFNCCCHYVRNGRASVHVLLM